MDRTEALKKIQNACGYSFTNIKLLEEALTHDSNRVNDRSVPTYQRLEFLGDSVLNFVVSDQIYRSNQDFNEGQLTNKRKELIESVKQSQIAEKLNIKDYIVFGQSVRKDQFSKYHSFVESLIGAVYIDGGLDKTRQVIHRLWELSDTSNAANSRAGCVIS
ncbi:unnamed protein product [Rotaria sp. Silwood2]|nr:unnamed protein product [Rotaria sp. Silwood2]CAF2624501.1 unnamed protein product [Rotaria sp. Silwood2]CAF3016199.1 unnamed protein product [Rotaria sp. Silwood2]CAF3988629.1 unnamed protein product [Rotaria sp. Silwood2]CAF4063934.1 unnamed protein product [Rotaria sp. Silwood2]